MTDDIESTHKTDNNNQFVDTQLGLHCLRCDQTLFSEYRHDFKRCDCTDEHGVFVDGGKSYFRMGYGNLAKYKIVQRNADGILYPDT